MCVCKIGNEKLRKRDSATKLLSEKVIKKESEGDFSGQSVETEKTHYVRLSGRKRSKRFWSIPPSFTLDHILLFHFFSQTRLKGTLALHMALCIFDITMLHI